MTDDDNDDDDNNRSVRCEYLVSALSAAQIMLLSVRVDICRNYVALAPSTREQKIAGSRT